MSKGHKRYIIIPLLVSVFFTAGGSYFYGFSPKTLALSLWQRCFGHKTCEIHIFVHGTVNTVLFAGSPLATLKDQIENSSYETKAIQTRLDQWPNMNQPINEFNIKRVQLDSEVVKNSDKLKFNGTYPLVSSYKKFCNQLNPIEERRFYTFGWTGLLSHRARIKAAIQLYNSLAMINAFFRRQKVEPTFKLIAHSHGGNVCLLLGGIDNYLRNKNNIAPNFFNRDLVEIFEALPNKNDCEKGCKLYKPKFTPSLKVQTLCMMGTPIQDKTESMAFSPLFKNIVNLYSTADKVQVGDGISGNHYYSSRKISKPTFFVDQCPNIMQCATKLICHRRKLVYNPGHCEFWSLNHNQNHHNPFNQMPLLPMIPAVLHQIENGATKTKTNWHDDLELRVGLGKLHLRINLLGKQWCKDSSDLIDNAMQAAFKSLYLDAQKVCHDFLTLKNQAGPPRKAWYKKVFARAPKPVTQPAITSATAES